LAVAAVTRFRSSEFIAQIGLGGMAEVYRRTVTRSVLAARHYLGAEDQHGE
jgi:hypothetical protein